jgi:hypothetical protein
MERDNCRSFLALAVLCLVRQALTARLPLRSRSRSLLLRFAGVA